MNPSGILVFVLRSSHDCIPRKINIFHPPMRLQTASWAPKVLLLGSTCKLWSSHITRVWMCCCLRADVMWNKENTYDSIKIKAIYHSRGGGLPGGITDGQLNRRKKKIFLHQTHDMKRLLLTWLRYFLLRNLFALFLHHSQAHNV